MSAKKFFPTLQGFVGAFIFWALAHSGPAIAQVAGSTAAYLKLQPAAPGTAQTGHANITGVLKAGQLQGNGAAVTNLDASNLTGGTVPDARLSIGGDASGPLSALSVNNLRGTPVAATAPQSGEVLKFSAGQWNHSADSLTLPANLSTNSNYAFVVQSPGTAIAALTSGSGFPAIQGTMGPGNVTVTAAGVSGVSEMPSTYGVRGYASHPTSHAGRFDCSQNYTEIGNTSAAIRTDGFLWRDYQSGIPSAAVPLAYGCINATGTIAGGTGNFSVTRTGAGLYNVTVTGETYSNSNCVVSITPVSSSSKTFGVVNPGGGPFLVRFWDSVGNLSDTQFQFTVWTNAPAEQG